MTPTPHITNGTVAAATTPAAAAPQYTEDDDDQLWSIFLPQTYTPSTKNPNDINPTFLPLINLLLAKCLPSSSSTLQSFQLWENNVNLDPGPTAATIGSLDVGQTLPICVQEQNATILITQQDQDLLTISTFRLSLASENITSNNSTFAMVLPTNSITTPKVKLLTSKTLIRQLADLHEVDMQESAATIKKSNTTVIEKRDVADPIYISKWLLSVITNKDTRQSAASDFPHICKKFRDSVRFKGGTVQRRLGMWVSIKGTLHLLLVKELGYEIGHFVYKTILIRFMVDLIKGRMPPQTPNMTRLEYLSKVARRVFKLDQLLQKEREGGTFPDWIQHLYQETLQETATVSHLHHDAMKKALVKFIEECKKAAKFDLSDIKLWLRQSLKSNNFNDLFHAGTTLGRFFKMCKLEVPIQIPGIRHRDNRQLFDYDVLGTVPFNMTLTMYDYEKNVSCWHTMLSSADSSFIWESFLKYHKLGKEFYKLDSVGYSRFILTLLKMVQLWDDIVVKKFPLLLEHRSGIDLGVLNHLLITNRRDLISLTKIETYFLYRDKKATYPSLIDETSPTPDSFAHRFVESRDGDGFRNVRSHILNWGKGQAVKKLKEVHEAREQCERIEGRARQLECEYTIDNWKRKHEPKCEKCKLNRMAKKMSVVIYESPLPVGLDTQNAVVFELLVPDQIGVLRDLLYLFKKEVTGNTQSTELYGPWHHYPQIVSCSKRERNFIVGLWSEKKTFKESHYRDLHPTNPDADFIKVNGMNCVYSANGQLVTIAGNGIKAHTTLKVEKKSRYSKMQSGIDGFVSQNEALASQCECNQDISLSEFVEFQSLRSISNLQFRNLFRAINAGNLTLKEESVFNLVCQVMWDVGGRTGNDDVYLRENQLDFSCNEFCEEFFVLLDNIRSKHADNWKDHYVMMTVIYITQTISQLNPAVERKAFKLLESCRKDAVRWSFEIQRILSSLTAAPRQEIDSLRIKLIEVNCCIAVTFRLDEIFLYEIITDGDFIYWLLAVARIHDNMVLLGSDSEHKLKQSLKNLVNRIDELGVELEPFIQEAVRSSDLLTKFVERHHSGSSIWKMREKQNMIWKGFEGGQVYYCDISPVDGFGDVSRIQMDLIKGKFLVDGCPVGYLPVTIEKHRLFQRAFGNKTFEVEAFAFQPGRVISKDKFLSSNYSFYLMDDKLTIIEHRENDVTLELIEDTRFSKNIPDLLVENYTHWFNYKAGQFEFFKKEEKLVIQQPEYILKIDDKKYLQLVKDPNRVVVDVGCPNYSSILRVVERLEQSRYCLVWCDMRDVGGYVYTVHLPRMGLQFSVRNVEMIPGESRYRSYPHHHHNKVVKPVETKRRLGDLVSKEYRGMRISTNQQSLETLIGLKNGLYLEDANVNSNAKMNSILLVPHARPYVRNKEVFIDTGDIRRPSFFAYEVDTRLKQLKSGDSRASWLYLAYLHALTNFGVPDPFTGVTGKERAMQILQSGLCFSSEPLDEESLKTMKMFMDLCPVRVYYPPNMRTMETVRNNSMDEQLPLRCAGDAYYLIIDQLIDDSQRLDFLYPDWKGYDASIEERCHWEEDLTWRAYWNRHYYSNEEAQLKGQFLLNQPITEPYSDYTHVDETMHNTVALSSDLHNWTINYCKTTVEPKSLLKTLLINGRDLKGVLQGEKFPIKEGVYVWSRVDFRDYWLDLYNLARKIKRKGLQSEWTFLLTYFNFKKDFTTIDQLRILHTIAVHDQLFEKLDPPDYDSYTNTLEVAFDKEEVKKILMCYKKPWESYLDRNIAEMKDWEDELEFAERMKPVQLELLNAQVEDISCMIEKRWPVDNLDWLLVDFEDRSELELSNACMELGLRIRSWFRNRELFGFLEEVATTLGTIKFPPSKARPECKKLFRHNYRYELEEFCSLPQTTVDFASLTANKEFKLAEQSSIELARRIFHNTTTTQTVEKTLAVPSDNDIKDFPLSLSEEQDDPILSDYMKDLKLSWKLHHKELKRTSKLKSNNEELMGPGRARWDYLSTQQRKNTKLCSELWEVCKQKFIPFGPITSKPLVDQILLSGEIFPRVVPLTMLKLLLKEPETDFEKDLRDLIGGYAVELTLEMKFSRCIRICQQKGQAEVELLQEMVNNGHENWNPSERPDWLLFEIESDLLIRPVQAKVAERMENPLNNENSVIQLNMGEGKTWVIVPLLALSLANGENLCRITVLKSLFQINKTYLSFKIGTQLLDRRIYCFPCRRDFKLGVPQSKAMLDVYEECLDLKGVVLTLPEYRLSFELKAYERFHIKAFEEGLGLFRLHDWLKDRIRDVLDESDEILHVKYQLIYTLGKQLPVTGGSTRWTVIQDLLSILPEEMNHLQQKLGSGFVEMKTRENAFPYCRILKMECATELVQNLARRIINRKTPIPVPFISQKLYFPLYEFFTNEQLSRDGLNLILKSFPETIQELFLVIRGYLACGVLTNCLTKRWRVNFGVAPSGPKNFFRRMAVPFRAKDVASDRIEFGHPDVAILLSQLSYYYSGLTDEQMEHCFGALLNLEPNPGQEYSKWVSLIKEEEFPSKSKIRTLSSINFNDFFQKTEVVFPLLRYNRNLINFYLSKAVFPQESKQFGWKIGCSPWDLCNTYTTGFSGTNDSKILLPSTIKQRDLDELKGTNGGVLASLLLQADNYSVLEKVTAVKLLKKLVDQNIRILLDVGALMLELDNEQVSRTWLQLLNEANVSVDAAVFFDSNDKLMVLDRLNTITPLELSTFRNRLDRCVVYLDDAHTRGTDLKIPSGNTAVVTLGKGVGKDKLVQGCMRMRKLGKGHNVLFWASTEVDESIKSFHTTTEKITAKEVLLWSIRNNQQQIKDGFVHWASAGVYVAQKLSSLKLYHHSTQLDSDLVVLSESCSQKEQIDLTAMYGDTRQIVRFPVIVDHLLKRVKRELAKLLSRKSSLKMDCAKIVEDHGQCVVDHVEKYVPQMMRSTQLLDEEQERELEHELEAQCHKQLPLRAKPMENATSLQVLSFIMTGSLAEIEKWALKLPLTLQNTSVWKASPSDRWGKHIYCTRDFINVVKSEAKRVLTDDYLRPVEWLASVQYDEDKTVLLLLSNYEAGKYLDLFRSNKTRATIHMHNALTSEWQLSLHDRPNLSLPKRVVAFDRLLNPPLTLFSGGWYFSSEEEERGYAWYLGYVEKVQDRILDEDGVVGRWVKKAFWGEEGVDVGGVFDECPEALVREILRVRWGIRKVGKDSGVGKVIG